MTELLVLLLVLLQIAVLKEMDAKGPFVSLVMGVVVLKDVVVIVLFALNMELVPMVRWQQQQQRRQQQQQQHHSRTEEAVAASLQQLRALHASGSRCATAGMQAAAVLPMPQRTASREHQRCTQHCNSTSSSCCIKSSVRLTTAAAFLDYLLCSSTSTLANSDVLYLVMCFVLLLLG
jgi:hypothetical protein